MTEQLRIATTGPSATAEPADPQVITELLRRQLAPRAFAAIQKIRRAEEPERRVGGGARNIIVDITSRLMRRTMRVESILEAAWAKVMSEDQHTLEIYEQAKHVQFRFKTTTGEVMVVEEFIDLFVISQRDEDEGEALKLVFASCMREDELVALANALPWRYVRTTDGWRDEALSWYFSHLGAEHAIWTDDAAIDIVLKNIEYTQSYRTLPRAVEPTVRDAVIKVVATFVGGTAQDLYERVPTCKVDDLLQLVVNGDGVFCDELRELISQPWRLHLYPAPILVQTVGRLPRPMPVASSVLDLCCGGEFQMGDGIWTVLSSTGKELLCKDPHGKLHQLDRRSIEDEFAKQGAVKAAPRAPGSAAIEVGQLDGKAKARLIELCQLQMRVDSGEHPVLTRGQEEALERYRELVAKGQDGRFAFIAGWRNSGRWGIRVAAEERALVLDVLRRERLRSGAHGLKAAYAVYVNEFNDDARFPAEQRLRATQVRRSGQAVVAQPMLRKAFKKLADSLHDEVEVELAQRGHKAANAAQVRRPVGGGTGVVGRGLTSQGLYPWDKGYADTTVVDAYTKDGVTGEVIRLRVTALRDGATDLVLAQVTEAHEPNEETFLELFRECVYRHRRLPRRIAFDNAKVYGGSLVVGLCATMWVERELGAKGHGRFRSEIEVVFHTLASRTELVEGTSWPAKNVRALSPSHRPDRRAIWPPGRFEDEVICEVLYKLLNERQDPKDGLSAQQRHDLRMRTDGTRENDTIGFDATFLTNSAPPVRTKGRNAGKLLVGPQGVRGERGEHFTCEALTRSHVIGTYVEAKREPWDISQRHVKVDGEWHTAISEALAEHLHGRSPREVKKLSGEMRARIGHEPDVRELGEFIARLRSSESELRKADKRDRLAKPLRVTAASASPSPAAAQDALEALDPAGLENLAPAPSAEDAA